MKLKNCPFCGSDNLSYGLNDNEDQSIWCENCSAAGPIHIYQIEAEMAWNTRAADKPTTSSSIVYESTSPHARLILDEE